MSPEEGHLYQGLGPPHGGRVHHVLLHYPRPTVAQKLHTYRDRGREREQEVNESAAPPGTQEMNNETALLQTAMVATLLYSTPLRVCSAAQLGKNSRACCISHTTYYTIDSLLILQKYGKHYWQLRVSIGRDVSKIHFFLHRLPKSAEQQSFGGSLGYCYPIITTTCASC